MNKYIITGGPSTGKTTLINLLKERRYRVVPEASRTVIEREQDKAAADPSYTPNVPWLDLARFQPTVMEQQLVFENDLEGYDGDVFLDRSMIDNIAYCQRGGIPCVPGIEQHIRAAGYDIAFFLEQVGYVNDAVRHEKEDEAHAVHEATYQAYIERMPLIIVPAMPLPMRLKCVVDIVAGLRHMQTCGR